MSAAVKGPWFDVPAETPASDCRSCYRTIYWIVTPAGKRMPVDCDVAGGAAPERSQTDLTDSGSGRMTEGRAGRGVSHFATCQQAAQWRKR